MSNYKIKTYADSYLFNNKIGKQNGENLADKTMKTLKDYIIKTSRIDKNSDAFRGIIEEVKRQQRSSLYYTILMMPNVELCVGPYELPRAFKVTDMKDLKNNGRPTIFIDVTGMIELTQNGYYICKKIDALCAYLIDAVIYMLYRYKTPKLVDNSNITIIGCESYVSMFAFILDYLRLSGYSANKARICYYIAKFYLINLLGKDENDPYINNIAIKVSGLEAKDVNAIKLFYIDGMFENIYTFITGLAETFRLKGLTLEVFITKWVYLFGTGSQYATELLTSFMVLICNAYSGAYIVNQKQIEKCCGAGNLTKVFAEIEKAGINSFDNRGYMESASAYEVHDKNSMELAKSLNNSIDNKLNESDFNDIDNIKCKVKSIKEFYSNSNALSKYSRIMLESGINALMNYSNNKSDYKEGALLEASNILKNTLNDSDSYKISNAIDNSINLLRENSQNKDSKEDKQLISRCIVEFMNIKNILL